MAVNRSSIFDQDVSIDTDVYPEWSLYVENIYMAIVALLGTPGNLLCIIVQIKFMKSSTDYFIFTMAMFDFFCAAVNAPLFIVRNVESLYTVLNSLVYCMIHKMLIYMTSVSTSSLLCAVALNRYFLTCHPFSKTYFKLILRVKEINIAIAVFSISVCAWIVVYEKFDEETKTCDSVDSFVLLILKGFIMMMFIALFAVGSICYIKVVMTIKDKHKLLTSRQRETDSNNAPSRKKAVQDNKINGLKQKVLFYFPSLKFINKVHPMPKQTVSTLTIPGTSDANENQSQSDPSSQDSLQAKYQNVKETISHLKIHPNSQVIYDETLTSRKENTPTKKLMVVMTDNYIKESKIGLLSRHGTEKKSKDKDTQSKENAKIKDPLPPISSTCSETDTHTPPQLPVSSDIPKTNRQTINSYNVPMGNVLHNGMIAETINVPQVTVDAPNKDESGTTKDYSAPREVWEASINNQSKSNLEPIASHNGQLRTPNVNRDTSNKHHTTSRKDPNSDKSSRKAVSSHEDSSRTSYSVAYSNKHEETINKMTLMLFLITVLYIVTWILHWISAFSDDISIIWIKGLMRSCKYSFMINCVTNPIFYSLMSSKFRAKVMLLFKCR